MGNIVGEVPTLLQDCHNLTADLSKLIQMAEIFKHPLTLVVQVGKNLIVNGEEIYNQITLSQTAYNN